MWKKLTVNFTFQNRFVIRETDGDKSKTSTLTILKSSRDDSHLYTCIVTNSFGKDEMNIQLIVQEPPDPPWNLTAVNVTSRSITVHWLNGFSGNSEILRHLVQYKVDKAENSQGPSDPSNEIEVTTLEEAPSGVSTQVNVYSAGSQSLKVMWKPVNKTLRNGQIKGYNVGFRKTSTDEPYQIRDIAAVTSASETDGWHTTYLTNLDRLTNYSVVVQAYNKAGFGPMTKEVIASTLETAPPTSPVVKATGVTATSASFQWSRDPKDKSAITEYIFHFKTTNGEWLKRHLHSNDNSLTLNDLRCGTRYEAYLTASNSLGTGEPSQTIRFRTKDSVPVPPPKDLFLEVHGTSLVLLLTTWKDGGCPIRNFTVLYKPKTQHRWHNVSHQVSYGNKKFTIPFLKPGETYELLVTARGDGGAIQVKYEFQTHRVITTFVASSTVKHKSRALPFHKNLILIVPVVVSAFVVTLIIIIVVVCLRKHPTEGRTSGSVRQRGKQSADENVVMGDLSEKLTGTTKTGRERQSYYSSPTRRPILTSHIGTRGRRPDNHEYAEPYASVPPPRRVPDGVIRDCIKDRPNEGTIRSTFSRPEGDIWNDGRSTQPPGLWERYEPSSNSSQSENSNDRTSSQYSVGRRIQV
ncbi:cell adhesion molecule DSCAM-like [Tachypleus tridentatus]|uniref:cell adhesion molecule DSCAM-like n=1 Tax=Tachypleus tridentatus TaxID=6853 RepID=UPI003FCF7F9D